jgi:hypothetical protein
MDGQWLGPWNELTTSKGPLHSILAAIGFRAGLHVYAYKRFFYLIASITFVVTALSGSRHWVRILVLTALLSDPFQFGEGGLRNLREGTYIPIQMIGFGLGVYSLDIWRKNMRLSIEFLASVTGMAVSFGLLMITREGRTIAWIELLLWIVIFAALSLRKSANLRTSGPPIIACLVIVFVGGIVPIQSLRMINNEAYGAPISNSLEEGYFPLFYGKLVSVSRVGEAPFPRVPLTTKTMAVLIEESGRHGGKVASILQGLDPSWKNVGCSVYPETCGELAGGWLQWSLRQSLSSKLMHPKNERAFQDLAQAAAEEMIEICSKSSRVSCDPRAERYLTPISRWGFRNPALELMKEASKIFSITLIPRQFPQGRPDYYSFNQWPPSKFTELNLSPMGTRAITIPESFRWSKATLTFSFLGFVLKFLLIALTVQALIRSVLHPSTLFDLDFPSLWLFGSLVLHLSVYTLLGLTSFSGNLYVTMASPIYIGWMGRVIASFAPLYLHRAGYARINIDS